MKTGILVLLILLLASTAHGKINCSQVPALLQEKTQKLKQLMENSQYNERRGKRVHFEKSTKKFITAYKRFNQWQEETRAVCDEDGFASFVLASDHGQPALYLNQSDKRTFSHRNSSKRYYPAKGMEVHAISIYESQLPNGVKRRFREIQEGSVQVVIRETQKPVMLLLSAYQPVHWQLQLADDAQLKYVLVMGRHEQRVTIAENAEVTVHILKKNVSFDGQYRIAAKGEGNNFINTHNFVQKLTGGILQTFQYTYKATQGFSIDKTTPQFILPQERSVDDIQGEQVLLVSAREYNTLVKKNYSYLEARQRLPSLIQPQIIDNFVFAKRIRVGALTSWMASHRYSKGKVYLEAQLKLTDRTDLSTHSNIAMVNEGLEYPGQATNMIGQSNRKKLKNGDWIGLAIDLDTGHVYVHLNGQWTTAVPDSKKTDPILKPGHVYAPAFHASGGEKQGRSEWLVNFGAEQFNYPIPKGYSAYDGSRK